MSDTANKEDGTLKDLLGPTDDNEDYDAREKIIGARVSLLLKQAFFGNLATRLKLVNADSWLTTAATDGRKFYYNSRFINMLDQKEIEFLVGHEVLHCVYDHMGRRDNRDPQLHNVACDYCVNADLVKHNIGRKITTIEILYDHTYDGMASEQVYDLLMENVKFINVQDLIDKLLDDHLDDKGEDGEDGENGRPGKLSDAEKAEIRDEFKEAVISAAQTVSDDNIPGNVKRFIQEITEPKMNWREILQAKFKSTVKDDYTWLRPSRRSWHMDAIMPGRAEGTRLEVAISIDSSGSMQPQMLQDFLGEVQGIAEEFTDYEIHLWCIDTEVYNLQTFTPDNIDDLDTYEIMGNGGNTFEENWNFMRKMELQPELFIMFTDGYPCPN